jgi:uncharacterized protein YndB with AHSA1/START domain
MTSTPPTNPNVPIHMEITVELPYSPEHVWEAIATANGISSWFLPTEMEERVGGRVVFHMGETSSEGVVTGWDPPRQIVYEEPNWADLTGHEGAPVTPLVTEFLVEAKSGGSCVVRVVSSAFGTGAEWEREFFEEMEKGWRPFFDNLRLYLARFPGQRVTSMSVDTQLDGNAEDVWAKLRDQLGSEVGKVVDSQGVRGRVERITPAAGRNEMLVSIDGPVPGFLQFMVYDMGDGKTMVQLEGYLFSQDAAAYVEREQPAWKDWLQQIGALSVRS